jgi:predicted RNase H-like HicB family nuclease
MANEFTAVFERDRRWYIAYCPEIPGANGQGKSKDEARASLADAIALINQGREIRLFCNGRGTRTKPNRKEKRR